MTAIFGAAGASGLIHRQPPEKIVRTLFPSLPTTSKEVLALSSHLSYGMSGGAIYACLMPARLRGPGTGTLFGAMVWLAGYEGWLPALDVLPPAHEDRPGRAGSVFVAHLVYGWTLGWAMRRLGEGREAEAQE
ncbi:hypothetical protein GCM10012320_25110 [Sinomonas cellulolyticus]|nr:hypothetical protein GCM10012320_25110 [Sinomonas sp. KCTC 49339]